MKDCVAPESNNTKTLLHNVPAENNKIS